MEKPAGFSKPLWESTFFVDFHSGVIFHRPPRYLSFWFFFFLLASVENLLKKCRARIAYKRRSAMRSTLRLAWFWCSAVFRPGGVRCGSFRCGRSPRFSAALLKALGESDTFPIEFMDRAVMRQPVQQSRRQCGFTKDARPLGKWEVRRDDQ